MQQLSQATSISFSELPTLDIKGKLLNLGLTNFNSGWQLLSASASMVAFRALSYLFQLHDSSIDLSDHYDFQALCQIDKHTIYPSPEWHEYDQCYGPLMAIGLLENGDLSPIFRP